MKLVRSVFGLGTLSLLAACGAGSAAEVIRPDAPTAAKALEEGECRQVDKGGEPLIVDWKPEQRGDLEVAMKEGVAVVAYSCQGIKLLSDCKIDGEYGFIGMTRREQVVRLEGADEVRANLPLSGVNIGGELQRGSTLDIAMMIVGKKRTTWEAPTKEDLKGKCDGATHFVRGAIVGAFAMGTGSSAKARVAAEIFGASAGAGSSSAKETQNRDGDVADCQKADPDSKSAPPQCGAPIRLVLAPIAKSAAGEAAPAPAKEAKVDSSEKRECPTGMVFADGKCTTPKAETAYECDPKKPDECKAQCDKGNAVSCGILGEQEAERNDGKTASEHLKKGCAGDHMRSCANLGKLMSLGIGMPQDVAGAIPHFEKACKSGDAVGCKELGRNYLHGNAPLAKDETKAATLFEQSCNGGDNQGCSFFAHSLEDGKGTAKDPAKAAQFYRRACDGGLAQACTSAGRMFESGRGVGKNAILASIMYQRACSRFDGEACTGLGRMTFDKTPDQAKRHFETACNARDAVGCAATKVLFGGQRVAIASNDVVQQLMAACRTGSNPECTSLGLLDVAKGNVPGGKMNLQQACARGDSFACAVMKKVP
jgi:uncharacterized protein